MQQDALAARFKTLARECGFDLVGIAPAAAPASLPAFPGWIERGYAAGMDYMVAQAERRFGAWGGLIAGTPDEVAVALRAEVDLGAELFTIPFTDFALPETLELFAEEVLPALRD